MQIKVSDQIFECINELSAVEQVFEKINLLISNSDYKISFLEVDNVKLYENYDQYILDHLDHIHMIVIHLKEFQELLNDTLVSISEYLERAIPEIDHLIDDFYQEVSQDTWQKFSQLLEGLQFIVNAVNVVKENESIYYNAQQYGLIQQTLISQIASLEQAVESQDRVYISDILWYEIVPSFKNLKREISFNTKEARLN